MDWFIFSALLLGIVSNIIIAFTTQCNTARGAKHFGFTLMTVLFVGIACFYGFALLHYMTGLHV